MSIFDWFTPTNVTDSQATRNIFPVRLRLYNKHTQLGMTLHEDGRIECDESALREWLKEPWGVSGDVVGRVVIWLLLRELERQERK